jgi:lysophospholipase L1-like esterase
MPKKSQAALIGTISSLVCLILVPLTAALANQENPQPPRFEKEIAAFEEGDRTDPPPKHAIVFVGSSTIRLWNLQKSFPGLDVINRGFGGSELADSVRFAPRIVTKYEPRLVVLYAGDNDLAFGKSPDQVVNDFRAFVTLIHKELPKTRVVYISIKPSVARWKLWDKVQATNKPMAAICKQDSRLRYVDLTGTLLGEDGTPKKELFLRDGLHLNDQGYTAWSAALRPILEERPASE